jgi:transposase InsO family protein
MSISATRRKYDTSVVIFYNQHKEHLLPESFRKTIAPSTITGWKNKELSSYYGHEFRTICDEAFLYYETFNQYQQLKKTVRLLTRVWIGFSNGITTFLNKNKLYKDKVIKEVQRLSTLLPKRIALKIAGLSSNAFQYRLNKLNNLCHDSAFALCLRKHPLQLSFKEMAIMKSLLSDQRFACWPVSSIAWFAQRNKLIGAALSTWYKYKPLLGFNKQVTQTAKQPDGLITSAPNQFLHVDTTFWNMENELKAAVVFVSDNFSKAIIGWNISLHKNAENVKCALNKAIQTINQYHPHHICTFLMADGGKENNNTTISELLYATQNPEITKIIAQKDIAFSNAPIEAINKIMKKYLRFYKPVTLLQLNTCIERAVYDYSFVRPHGSLNGRIPMEVYTNQQLNMDTKAFMIEAKNKRIEQNRKHTCGICK